MNKISRNIRGGQSVVTRWYREDFDYIQRATEITVLGSKKLSLMAKWKLQEAISKAFFYILNGERKIAEAYDRKFTLKNFGLDILIKFNPRKAGLPPYRESYGESLRMAIKSGYYDKELTEQLAVSLKAHEEDKKRIREREEGIDFDSETERLFEEIDNLDEEMEQELSKLTKGPKN